MTPLLNSIADAAGERAAVILAREKGGQQIYVPERVTADHWLVALLGIDAATALAAAFGSRKIVIPIALMGDQRRRAAAIAELLDKGYSINAIVRITGVSRTTVREHARRKRDDRQGCLF
jgi:DNA-binding NarL/FixJ family response regulator